MIASNRLASFCCAMMFLLGTSGVAAQIPQGLEYQGFLTDAAGAPLDQAVSVSFAFYAVETGGAPLWSETIPLVPSQGLFSTTLGVGASPFPADLFATPLWVGITVETDTEMTPRRPLRAAAYAMRAVDADTLGGLPPFALDQSTDVLNLSNTLSNTNINLNSLTFDVSANTSVINAAVVQADTNASDIAALQSDLTVTASDVTSIENTLPTLQTLISGSCGSGSSIRQVFSNGTVTCEVDDSSLWSMFNDNLYYTGGSIAVGTFSPLAAIHIDAPSGVDPFRARVGTSTKLRVHLNGSVSLGSNDQGPDDGIQVAGDARIGVGASNARLTASDALWQAALVNTDSGGDDWYLGSSATGWAVGAGKFVISPSDSSGNSALVIDSNKDVGVGVTDPATRLHVGGGSDVTPSGGGYMTIGSSTGTNIAVDNNEIMARSSGSATALALNAEGGEVRINTNGSRDHDSLEVRGRIYFDNGGNSGMRMTATNSNPTNAVLNPTQFEEALVGESAFPFWRVYSREFYAQTPLQYKTYSDRSLKTNVQPITGALATIAELEGVTYELSKHPMDTRDRERTAKEEFDRRNQIGFIAQDVEKVLPQMVSEDEFSGLKSVGYMGMIPILVEAIKEQQRQIDDQQREIDELRARLDR